MGITQQLTACHKLDIALDEDLFTAMWISFVAQKHLLVSSIDRRQSCAEIGFTLNKLWGLKPDNQFKVIELNSSSDFYEDFASKLPLDRENYRIQSSVLILIGLEFTTQHFQKRISYFLRDKWLDIDGVEFVIDQPLFTSIVLVQHRDSLEIELDKRITLLMWLRQQHIPKTNITIGFDYSTEKAFQIMLNEMYETRNKYTNVKLITEIKTYVYDIIIFTRMHRMVVGGVPTQVMRDFDLFLKILAVLKNINYVLPDMVKLAAFRLLPLKIKLQTNPANEPTLLYGSDQRLIEQIVDKWDAEMVIEDVLNNVQPPV